MGAVERYRRVFQAWLVVFLGVAVVLACLLGLALHGANLYPRFYTLAAEQQRSGHEVWVGICQEGRVRQPPELVRCDQAQADAQLSVRGLALEETIRALWRGLVGTINPLSWFNCHQGSSCHFVLFKAIEHLTSSLILVLVLLILILLGVLWLARRGPLQSYQAWQHQALLAQCKRSDLDFHPVTWLESPEVKLLHK